MRNAESVLDTRHHRLTAESSAAVISRFPFHPVQPQVGLMFLESAESVGQSCTAADCSGGRGFQELELGQVQIRQHGAVLEKVVVRARKQRRRSCRMCPIGDDSR